MNTQAQQRSIAAHVGGRCELNCAACDCRTRASEVDWIRRTVREGGRRLVLRGAPSTSPVLDEVLREARSAGIPEVVVRTNALAYAEPARAAELAAKGVHAAIVPLFSHVTAVHDRIAGQPGALARSLAGMRALAASGIAIEVEIPLLESRLQDAAAVVELAHRAVPSLRAVRLFHPRWAQPVPLAPPKWPDGSAALAKALETAARLGLKAELSETDAIPFCALASHPEQLPSFRFKPNAKSGVQPGASLGEACGGCAMKQQCAGIADSYRAVHGEAGIVPFAKRPRSLVAQRTTPRRTWTEAQRDAARKTDILVLRPTVNCNQDCTFCSANETTGNVWSDPDAMLRAIARAARRGIQYLSFSGGEPTLSKDLPRFIRVARRCGIREVELVTNAVLLDSEKRVTALKEAGLTNAFVSLHAHNEALSRLLTQKVGDWERTVTAIGLLVAAGIEVTLNHVVSERNYRHLSRFFDFVHARFGRRVAVSLAFVTPQYKALEDLTQVPRLSDVAPYLRRGLRRALAHGIAVVVGSRQGVPPCFLGEFRGWSDVLFLANEGRSEDQPQKTQGPQCEACAYAEVCTGVWKPYAARYGTDELEPVAGPRIGEAERRALEAAIADEPFQRPSSFEQIPEALRDRTRETETLAERDEPVERVALPVVALGRTRPVRLLMVGSGRQARRLARAVAHVEGVGIDAVASPHAPDTDLPEFGGCPSYRDASEAADDIRPEGAIIASSTATHLALTRGLTERRIPILLEKPLASTLAEAEEIVGLAETTTILPAHNVLFAPGLLPLLDARPSRVSWSRRTTIASQDTPPLWSRAAIGETLHHAIAIVRRAMGAALSVVEAQFLGEAAPERIRLLFQAGSREAEVVLEFRATKDEAVLLTTGDDGATTAWKRTARSITRTDASGTRPVESDGGEVERMLAHFRDVVLGRAAPLVSVAESYEVLSAVHASLELLEKVGAPFDRPNAPKHVATRVRATGTR